MRRVISAAFHLLVLVALFNALILLIRNLRHLRRLEDEHPPDADDLPSINVLIPARNERDVLPRCLDSLQNQLYSRFSVTVLDDGSNDGTGDLVKGYSSHDFA